MARDDERFDAALKGFVETAELPVGTRVVVVVQEPSDSPLFMAIIRGGALPSPKTLAKVLLGYGALLCQQQEMDPQGVLGEAMNGGRARLRPLTSRRRR